MTPPVSRPAPSGPAAKAPSAHPPSADRLERERRIDEALLESFPASDPPGWTLGVTPRATDPPPAPDRDRKPD